MPASGFGGKDVVNQNRMRVTIHDGTELRCLTGGHLSATSLVMGASGPTFSPIFACRL